MAILVVGCASPAPSAVPTASATPAAPSPGPSLTARSTDTTDGVTVIDLSFDGGRPTDAYLVLPVAAAPGSARGILWFHWLETGAPTSNRTEFLAESRQLAAQDGVVSLLVDGTFPWHESPRSIAHDTAAIEDELTMLGRAYELLVARPEVDRTRTALVGHDFGAMYSAASFAANPAPRALVMMAPTARWADWYLRYWSIPDDPDAYRATLAPYDPVTALAGGGGRAVLLQFATLDQYVPADVADEITTAAGPTAERHDYDTGHELDEAAQSDRDAWLIAHL